MAKRYHATVAFTAANDDTARDALSESVAALQEYVVTDVDLTLTIVDSTVHFDEDGNVTEDNDED